MYLKFSYIAANWPNRLNEEIDLEIPLILKLRELYFRTEKLGFAYDKTYYNRKS